MSTERFCLLRQILDVDEIAQLLNFFRQIAERMRRDVQSDQLFFPLPTLLQTRFGVAVRFRRRQREAAIGLAAE
jgi:hypothetical protein